MRINTSRTAICAAMIMLYGCNAVAPDDSFGIDGYAEFTGHETSEFVETIAVDALDRIIVVMNTSISNQKIERTMARFDQDGILDLSFGNNGSVTLDLPDGVAFNCPDTDFNSECTKSLQVLPDGHLLLLIFGNRGDNYPEDYPTLIARYQPNGLLDTTFANNGFLEPSFAEDTTVLITALQVDTQPNGQSDILVTGVEANPEGQYVRNLVARYTPGGKLDRLFEDPGFVPLELRVDPKSKNVAVGGFTFGQAVDNVALYNPDGSLDDNFPVATIDPSIFGSSELYVEHLAFQSSGKVIVFGRFFVGIDGSSFAFRYTAEGTLDPSFGDDGSGMFIRPFIANTGQFAVPSSWGTVMDDDTLVLGVSPWPYAQFWHTTAEGKEISSSTITPPGATYLAIEEVGIQRNGQGVEDDRIVLGGWTTPLGRASKMLLIRLPAL